MRRKHERMEGVGHFDERAGSAAYVRARPLLKQAERDQTQKPRDFSVAKQLSAEWPLSRSGYRWLADLALSDRPEIHSPSTIVTLGTSGMPFSPC